MTTCRQNLKRRSRSIQERQQKLGEVPRRRKLQRRLCCQSHSLWRCHRESRQLSGICTDLLIIANDRPSILSFSVSLKSRVIFLDIETRRTFIEEISTEEFPHPTILPTAPIHGPVQKITLKVTEPALKRMRSGKVSGPNDVAADFWKSKFWYPAE